jgi:hypothetical protein
VGRIAARVLVEAVGGAGVERAVGDELERTDSEQVVHRLAAAQPEFDRTVEVLGVDAEVDAQRPGARLDAAGPGVEVPVHLEVDDAHDAAGGGGLGRGVRPAVEHLVGDRAEPTGDRERGFFDEHTRRVPGVPEQRQRRRVEPDGVQVAAHQHDGARSPGGVERLDSEVVGPQAVAEAVADERLGLGFRRFEGRRDHLRGLAGGCRGRHVEALLYESPLAEVHVVVPEAGRDPAALEVEPHGRPRGRRDRHDASVDREDVDERAVGSGDAEVTQEHGSLRRSWW